VLDGLEALCGCPDLQIYVAAILEQFLRGGNVHLLCTSTERLREVLFPARTQSSFFWDLQEVVVRVHPLDDRSAITMLKKYVSRNFVAAELGIDAQEYSDDDERRALGNSRPMKATCGVPSRIVELARLLKNIPLDQVGVDSLGGKTFAATGA